VEKLEPDNSVSWNVPLEKPVMSKEEVFVAEEDVG
jgi:hypothetical protein